MVMDMMIGCEYWMRYDVTGGIDIRLSGRFSKKREIKVRFPL
jgi:hypothetical protein